MSTPQHGAAKRSQEEILKELGLDKVPSPEDLRREIEEEILLPKVKLPEHWLSRYQIHWEHKTTVPSLLTISPAPPPTTLTLRRAGLEGRVTGYVETRAPRQQDTALTSTALTRAPGPGSTFIRGKSGYVPFKPGGLDDVFEDELTFDEKGGISVAASGLRRVPPGFERGLRLGDEDEDEFLDTLPEGTTDYREDIDEYVETLHPDATIADGLADALIENDLDSLLPVERFYVPPAPVQRKNRRAKVTKRDWAHVVDVNRPMTNFHELVPDMAHKYPFELDTFQKEAVYHLEMGDSVFVAAHTSAGKTVVAEYAIALATKHMTRAIYTSPIKALSNQKFRDFKNTFDPSTVGILTGDVQINPEGSCLIMTTEILRSMLYKGADLIRDVEFVIFDEVHYVNDAERGVVWEEVIIMLPDHVNIILLSATVPNTKEFADWVGRTKKKDIYVISTLKRPIPLEHYLYAGRDMFKIVDATGQWVEQSYKQAGEALKRKQDKEREAAGLPPVQRLGAKAATAQRGSGQRPTGRGTPGPRGGGRGGRGGGGGQGFSGPRSFQQQDKNLWVYLVGHLKKKALLPVVVFTFSKKKCEENAGTLSNTDLCTASEKSEVHITIERALTRLKGSDKRLPQIGRMKDLLSRGIAVHHGGLLPIVKEVVELLFARGLVKVLFATETFAMGVNMPARSVVFSGIRKHDGRSFREIMPGEYTQMSGRAGRRGLDDTGVVIIVSGDDIPDTTTLHKMILGQPTKLQSQFRLTYNMILNLLRVEALKVEEMIKRSFSENASQRLLPDQQKKVVEAEKLLVTMPKLDCDICQVDIRTYYDISGELVSKNQDMLRAATGKPQGRKLLTSGRVVILRDSHYRANVAVLFRPTAPLTSSGAVDQTKHYFILAAVSRAQKGKRTGPADIPPLWPPTASSLLVDDVTYELDIVPITSISMITSSTLKVDETQILELKRISHMQKASEDLLQLVNEWIHAPQRVPNALSIPEVDWNKVRDFEFQEALKARATWYQRLSNMKSSQCPQFENHYLTIHDEQVLLANIAKLKLALSDQNLELLPDYEQRVEVLKELKHIDENSTVLLKGRVACEINSANELVLTELILENTLASYEPEEVVALLSAFVFQEKTDIEPVIPPKLQEGRAALMEIAGRVGRVQDSHSVAAPDAQTTLKFGLVEVVYEWAKGMPFEQITSLTDVAEGSIVRVITRLDETCREVRDAARVIGDAELFKKMEDAQLKIKRDIVFAASLYF